MAAFRTSGNLESIVVTPANGSVGKGAVIQFTATAEFDNSSSTNVTNSVTWSSSNMVAATINPTGLVTALAPGSTTIQASLDGVIGSTNLTITQSQSNFLGVLTQHNDNGRTGQNLNETALAPTNVQVNTFGKLFSVPVDGFVYAQPLYVPNVLIGSSIHNVVYVATEADSVYAFDADTGAQLWRASLIDQAHGTTITETTVNVPQDVDPSCNDSASPVGITGTPVIDTVNGLMYVVAKSKTADPMFPTVFIQRLHMLDITSGAEKSPGPAIIAPTVSGHSDGGTTVTFDPLQQINRSGLLLSNGQVYLAYGAHCDEIPYHGWLLAYDAKTLTQTAAFVATPDNPAMQGGIWLGGAGIAADAAGTIFTAIGNGPFDSTDFGDTIVKLALNGSAFSVGDSFTPWDQSNDQGLDLDVGSNGVILLPDQSGPHPHLLIAGAKNGMIYLINRDQFTANNQHYCSNCSSDPQIVQEFHGDANGNTLFGTPAFWNGTVFVGVDHNSLDAFKIENGQINTTPASTTSSAFPFPGVTPSISANGNTNGIVWVVDSVSGGARLRAFDATNLASELWNSNLAANNRDQAGAYVKRAVPTIANGKVYIGTQEELDVYGLLP
jgi:outer membrane protein assembly factor BamB